MRKEGLETLIIKEHHEGKRNRRIAVNNGIVKFEQVNGVKET